MIDLRALRVDKGLTQAQLAAKADTTRTVITNIENGVALPSIPTAKALGEVLEFEWWKFFVTEEK